MNLKLLNKVIKESGFKLSFIASKLGISNTNFTCKLQGKGHFKVKGAQIIGKLLHLEEEEVKNFFGIVDDFISTINERRVMEKKEDKLKKIILEKGLLLKDVANSMGLTPYGFALKRKKARFNIEELKKLTSILELSKEEAEDFIWNY